MRLKIKAIHLLRYRSPHGNITKHYIHNNINIPIKADITKLLIIQQKLSIIYEYKIEISNMTNCTVYEHVSLLENHYRSGILVHGIK